MYIGNSAGKNKGMGPTGKPMKYKDCWSEWCCPGRCGFFTPVAVGLLIAFSILGFVFALWAWQSTQFAITQHEYTASALIAKRPYAAILTGATAQEMVLPNNLLEYMGATYRVVCVSPTGHSVKIQLGLLTTTWDGTNNVITCPVGVPNAGFDYHVISPSIVYLTNVHPGITFSST